MFSFTKVIDGGLYTNYSFTKDQRIFFISHFVKVNRNVDKHCKTGEYKKDKNKMIFSFLLFILFCMNPLKRFNINGTLCYENERWRQKSELFCNEK